jgi:DNA polymerase I
VTDDIPVVVDFENLPIIDGSGKKPKPVGVSILEPGVDNTYWGFAHPGYNPHTYEDAKRALVSVWERPMVFHNCKHDIGVALEHFDLPWPERYDDTMFQAYLVSPLERSLGLKDLAQRLLGIDPEERDAVYAWLKANFKGPFLDDHKTITEKNAGAYIGYAPYEVVAPYAMGDTSRTRGLHAFLRPKIEKMGMDAAYQRELAIAQVGYWMERRGVRVDRPRLLADYEKYEREKANQTRIITSYLGDIDVGKPAQVARAILEKGYADELPRTPTGRMSTSKASIESSVTEPALLKALRYRATLKTLTQTFFKGWVHFSAADGHVHPSWNQTLNTEGYGARTGRFSCSDPNLTNVPTEFDTEHEEQALYGCDLPFMRQYILPDEGQIIVPADFNGQEMRIMAHYAEGRAQQIYQEDPQADFHAVASALIKQYVGLSVPRKMCKIVGFSLIYGSGIATLARQLTTAGFPTSEEQARKIKNAYFKAIPGLADFIALFRNRKQVKTWGGRILPAEEPRIIDGEWREFYYKLCNYLIQGSAADQSKEAMLRYNAQREHGRLLMMVHDELVISTPEIYVNGEVPILKASMEEMPGWDVPFRVEVEYGHNWHDLKEFA